MRFFQSDRFQLAANVFRLFLLAVLLAVEVQRGSWLFIVLLVLMALECYLLASKTVGMR